MGLVAQGSLNSELSVFIDGAEKNTELISSELNITLDCPLAVQI